MLTAWKQTGPRVGCDPGPSAGHWDRGALLWGVTLVAIGVLFLLDRTRTFDFDHLWQWWPLVGIVWGASRILTWNSAADVGSGISWMLLSVWMLASSFEWYGLNWSNSWPLVLVAFGAGMVATALLRPVFIDPAAAPAPEAKHDA